MSKLKLTIFSILVHCCTYAVASDEPTAGKLLKVKGKNDLEQISKEELNNIRYSYFPNFKELKLTDLGEHSMVLLEGMVLGGKKEVPVQNVRVYVKYEKSAPRLLAIVDADGKIKMKIQKTREIYVTGKDGVIKKDSFENLERIYLGDPTQNNSVTRMYKVSDIRLTK